MTTDPASELAQFHAFVGNCLSKGESLPPEVVLDLWRIEHPGEWEAAETVAAVEQALSDMEAGDAGMPLDEFVRQFRQQHGLVE